MKRITELPVGPSPFPKEHKVYDAPSGAWKFIVNPTIQERFGISEDDERVLRELRSYLDQLKYSNRFLRCLEAFDKLTGGRFK